MTSYIDDKLAAFHVKILSPKLIPFCNGGSINMGLVEVGDPLMQSFWVSKVIAINFNLRCGIPHCQSEIILDNRGAGGVMYDTFLQ